MIVSGGSIVVDNEIISFHAKDENFFFPRELDEDMKINLTSLSFSIPVSSFPAFQLKEALVNAAVGLKTEAFNYGNITISVKKINNRIKVRAFNDEENRGSSFGLTLLKTNALADSIRNSSFETYCFDDFGRKIVFIPQSDGTASMLTYSGKATTLDKTVQNLIRIAFRKILAAVPADVYLEYPFRIEKDKKYIREFDLENIVVIHRDFRMKLNREFIAALLKVM